MNEAFFLDNIPAPKTTIFSCFAASLFFEDEMLRHMLEQYTGTFEYKDPQKRLAHALQRIKSKGYYARNLEELFNNTKKTFELQKKESVMLLSLAVGVIFDPAPPEFIDIPDKIWFLAIECAMQSLHPDLYADPDVKFGPYIDQDIGTIYNYVTLLAYINEQAKVNGYLREDLAELDNFILDDENCDDCPDPEETQAQQPAPDTGLLNALRQRNGQLQEALSKEKQAHDKTILRFEHEIDRQKKEHIALESKIQSLREQNAQLMEFILHQDSEQEQQEEETVPSDLPQEPASYAYPLPESRVLFLGGHRNFVKKVEALHPDWLYLSDNNIRTRGASNIDVIFFWTAHSSHTLQEKVFADLPDIPPIIYVKSTNIDLLEQEMLRGYNSLKTE